MNRLFAGISAFPDGQGPWPLLPRYIQIAETEPGSWARNPASNRASPSEVAFPFRKNGP